MKEQAKQTAQIPDALQNVLKQENTMTQEMMKDIYFRYPHSEDDGEYFPTYIYQMTTGSGKTFQAAQSMALTIKYGIQTYKRQFFIATKKNMLPPDHLLFSWDQSDKSKIQDGSDFYSVFLKYGVDYDKHVLRLSAQQDYFICPCGLNDQNQLSDKGKNCVEGNKQYYNRYKHIMSEANTALAQRFKRKLDGAVSTSIDNFTKAMTSAVTTDNYKEAMRVELNKSIAACKHFCLKELEDILEAMKMKDPKKIALYIRNEETWLYLLFPDLCKELYDVLFMTVTKFVSSFNPRKDTGLNVTTSISEYLKGSLVYVDEIDSVKSELQKYIIENAQGVSQQEGNNYLTIFANILNFKAGEYNADLTRAINEVKTAKYSLEGLKKRRDAIKPFTRFQQRYKTDGTISTERYSIFMFRDSFDHKTFVFNPRQAEEKDGEKQKDPAIYITVDEKKQSYAITIQPDIEMDKKEKRYKPIKEDEAHTRIEQLVDTIQSYFFYFQYFVHAVAQKYRTIRNNQRKTVNPLHYHEMTEDDAFASVIKEFLGHPDMTKQEIQQYKTILSYHHTELKVEGVHINTIDYYQNGFTALSLADDDSHDMRTDMLYLSVLDTPEKIILDWLTNFAVVGLSATAEVKSVLCNFDWDYIADEIGQDHYHTASQAMIDDFKKTNQEIEKNMEENGEEIDVQIVESLISDNQNKSMADRVVEACDKLYDQIKKVKPTVHRKIFDTAAHIIQNVPCSLYYKNRYLKTFTAMIGFFLNGHTAFLHYSMAYPETADNPANGNEMQADWLTLQMLFRLAAAIPKKKEEDVSRIIDPVDQLFHPNGEVQRQTLREREHSNKAPGALAGKDIDSKSDDPCCYLFRACSENFEQTKRQVQELWEHGHPAYLIVSQMTASAGQNYQYSIQELGQSEKSNLITLNHLIEDTESDGRFQKVNIDGLYIEPETHILTNINGSGPLITPKMAADYMCQVCGLQRHYEIGKNDRDKAIRETFHEMWRQYYNGQKSDSEDAVGPLKINTRFDFYKLDSVALAQLTMLEQIVGRMSRTFIDRRSTSIYLDAKLVEMLSNNEAVRYTMEEQYDRGMMTPKMKRVMDVLICMGNAVQTNKKNKQFNCYDSVNKTSKKYIYRAVREGFHKQWRPEQQHIWEMLRDITLTLGVRTTEEEIKSVLTDEQRRLMHEFRLYCDVSALSEDDINTIIKKCYVKEFSKDPMHSSRMDVIMANDELRAFFEAEGYKTDIGTGNILIVPYAFQAIYKGAVGEVTSTHVLGQYGIILESITDGALFEKGDRMLAGHPDTLVDLKLVSFNFAKDQMTTPQMIHKIWDEKIQKTSIKNFIVIETVLPEGLQVEHWGADDLAKDNSDVKASIYSVPGLIDQNGMIIPEGINCMKEIIKAIDDKNHKKDEGEDL